MEKIRKTTEADIPRLMEIYDSARAYMRNMGNMNQWINGYPSQEIIKSDIQKKNSYVYCLNGIITAGFYFGIEEDPTYKKIYSGRWLNEKPYGVIHRLAVGINKNGIASKCLAWCFKKIKNIRIDTHADNLPMKNLLTKAGYKYCGIIHLLNGDERLAFQKTEGLF